MQLRIAISIWEEPIKWIRISMQTVLESEERNCGGAFSPGLLTFPFKIIGFWHELEGLQWINFHSKELLLCHTCSDFKLYRKVERKKRTLATGEFDMRYDTVGHLYLEIDV